ncbi:MAG: NADH-quinone oxidoreductase subunit NuoE [Syntrophorhabdales bacterium]|jgi:NADH:ubiquinone oxidoreductase subunit E
MNDQEEMEIEEIIGGIEDVKTAKIRLLQELQKKYGYLREDHMRYVAKRIGDSYTDLYGIATFYSQFNLNPAGRHTIYVCEGTSCHVKGGKKLLSKIGELLGVKVKETTEDKRFTLKVVRCLGCCGISPTIMIDNETFGRVRSTDLTSIFCRFE